MSLASSSTQVAGAARTHGGGSADREPVYEAPALTVLGGVADVTLGHGSPGNDLLSSNGEFS